MTNNEAISEAIAPAAGGQAKRKVLIVDDHPIVRQGLAMLINQTDDLEAGGEASSAREALDAIARSVPDIALVDLTLGATWGISLIEDIRKHRRNLPILVVSMHSEELYAERALRSGAQGYIMKSEPPETLLKAIRSIVNGEIYLSETMRNRILRKLTQPEKKEPSISSLSNRELEVFNLMGQGVTTRDVARKLFLSVKTVETHYAHIKRKLDLSTTRELALYASSCISRGDM